MTLDEAIDHCKENIDCTECGKEHQQLMEFLIELKLRREIDIELPSNVITKLETCINKHLKLFSCPILTEKEKLFTALTFQSISSNKNKGEK